jgi:hypothetical protein
MNAFSRISRPERELRDLKCQKVGNGNPCGWLARRDCQILVLMPQQVKMQQCS